MARLARGVKLDYGKMTGPMEPTSKWQGDCTVSPKWHLLLGFLFPETVCILSNSLPTTFPAQVSPGHCCRTKLDQQPRQKQPWRQCRFCPDRQQPVPTGYPDPTAASTNSQPTSGCRRSLTYDCPYTHTHTLSLPGNCPAAQRREMHIFFQMSEPGRNLEVIQLSVLWTHGLRVRTALSEVAWNANTLVSPLAGQ